MGTLSIICHTLCDVADKFLGCPESCMLGLLTQIWSKNVYLWISSFLAGFWDWLATSSTYVVIITLSHTTELKLAHFLIFLSAERAGPVPWDWPHLPLCQAVRSGPYNVHGGDAWHYDQASPCSYCQAHPHICHGCHGISYAWVPLQWVLKACFKTLTLVKVSL